MPELVMKQDYLFEDITPKKVVTKEGAFTVTMWCKGYYLTNEQKLIKEQDVIMEK